MGDFDYDAGGHTYTSHRQPDPHIAAMIVERLGDARTVVNVGAGAGSYEPNDRYVVAVEPSRVMRAQRPPEAAPAIIANAQTLPFDDNAFDAAMAIATIHQWGEGSTAGLHELRRVASGPIVIMTFDDTVLRDFWITDYVPEFLLAERSRLQPIEWVCEQLGGRCTVDVVPIPIDCTDGFMEAFYARPEMFLDESVRRAQSAWGFVGPGVEERFDTQLRADLASGAWDRRYGYLREQATFNGTPRIITALPG
jgi:SAM-dependent methyltransferase